MVCVDALRRQEVLHAHDADALVDLAQQVGEHGVAGRLGQRDVEGLVEQHEARVGLRLVARPAARHSSRSASSEAPVVACGRGGPGGAGPAARAPMRDLVEVAHRRRRRGRSGT